MSPVQIPDVITANTARWPQMVVDFDAVPTMNQVAAQLVSNKATYQALFSQTSVPWPVIAVIHERECSQRWDLSIAQGDPWNAVSVHVPAGRGPFSVKENRRQIRAFGIGVMVTKDSGRAGGTPEKLDAARLENCQVIVVHRPEWTGDNLFSDLEPLLEAIGRLVPRRSPTPSGRGSG